MLSSFLILLINYIQIVLSGSKSIRGRQHYIHAVFFLLYFSLGNENIRNNRGKKQIEICILSMGLFSVLLYMNEYQQCFKATNWLTAVY